MIRKLAIAMLTIAAGGMLMLWAVTAFAPQHFASFAPNDITYCDLRGSYAYFYALRNKSLATLPGPSPSTVWRLPYVVSFELYGRPKGWRVMHLSFNPLSLALILGVYPMGLFAFGPLRGYLRRKQGRCPRCGYNLRGNVSGICSECGAAESEKEDESATICAE